MIIQEFNNGWGENVPLRQFEREIRDRYLAPVMQDQRPTVIVNSTWYTQDYHQHVIARLQELQVDRVILTAMMDPAIPQQDWFGDREVWGLGYYKGQHEIDAWALIMDRFFQLPSDDLPMLDTAFMCLNRKPHWHRRRLYDRLQAQDLLRHGVVTLGSMLGQAVRALDTDVEGSPLAPNPGIEQYGIANDIMTLGPVSQWQRCFLNIVTETVFDVDSAWFVSEKIYKPVVGLRPFLVYAPNGAGQWLDHVGLETFVGDFQDITDCDASDPDQLPSLLRSLCDQSPQYYQSKYLALMPKMLHNRDMFDRHVRRTWDRVNEGASCQI